MLNIFLEFIEAIHNRLGLFLQKSSDPFDHLSKVEHLHADFKTGFRFEVAYPKKVRHPSKVLFSKLTTVRVARFGEFQVCYFRSQIAC